jgi:hypothetical protein
MMKHNDHVQGPNGHAEHSGIDLVGLLVANRYVQKLAWLQLGDEHEGVQEEDAPPIEKLLSPEAKRKRDQRIADKAAGWAQCHAKAPDDADARELVSLVATGIMDPTFRAAIWIAVRKPHIVSLGAQVYRLAGVRRFILRSIIGPFETRANS